MKLFIRRRKEQALKTLQAQLVRNDKPVKGPKPQATDKDGNLLYQTYKDPKTQQELPFLDSKGNKKPLLLDNIPLDKEDITRIKKEIASLESKLKISSIL